MKRAALEQISATPLKQRLFLSLKSRFRSPITDVEAMEKAKRAAPKNTKLANEWALHTLETWMSFRNFVSEEKAPACQDPEIVCFWFCHFISDSKGEWRAVSPSYTKKSHSCIPENIAGQ